MTQTQREPIETVDDRACDDELAAAINLVQRELGGVVVWSGRRGECPLGRCDQALSRKSTTPDSSEYSAPTTTTLPSSVR